MNNGIKSIFYGTAVYCTKTAVNSPCIPPSTPQSLSPLCIQLRPL